MHLSTNSWSRSAGFAAAAALGPALAAVKPYVEPALARSVQARENLYDALQTEFGLLTPAEAGRRMGSRSSPSRNYANATRGSGRILSVRRNGHAFYLASSSPPMASRSTLSQRTEAGIVQWLLAPTTYLDGDRPVDHLRTSPGRVLTAAEEAWGVEW